MPAPEVDLHTGVGSIDDEHEILLLTLKDLEDAVDARRDDPGRLDVGLLLERLWAQITAHFAHEEQAMRDAGYPLIAEHLARHRQFLRTLTSVRTDQAAGDESATTQWMVQYVRTWFVQHTRMSDEPFARWLLSGRRAEPGGR